MASLAAVLGNLGHHFGGENAADHKISCAHALGKKLVAPGVHLNDQRKFSTDLLCDIRQQHLQPAQGVSRRRSCRAQQRR